MSTEGLHAEQRARVLIDGQLTAAGWFVCDLAQLKLIHQPNCAVREVVMKSGSGRADYLLYVERKIVGVIEAKPEGTSLTGVEWQSAMYSNGLKPEQQLASITVEGRLPFVFEASGTETHFTNGYDPSPRARRISAFPRPATLARIVREAEADPQHPTWRAKVRSLPELDTKYRVSADSTAVDVDLDREPAIVNGERVDEQRARELAAESLAALRQRNLVPGGESLSGARVRRAQPRE